MYRTDGMVVPNDQIVLRVGGAIVDGVRLTWPLAVLTATTTSLRIETAFGGKYVVMRAELKRLRRRWGFLWPRLDIEHYSKNAPRDLGFIPWNRRRLVRELRALGYDVL
jgi:hypothetical protein